MKTDTKRVLMVEDNPGDARLIRETLAESGNAQFELEHVETLSEAIKRVEEERFDAILLDLGLPDSQGLDTPKSMRKQAPGVPIVVLSGLDDEKMAIESVNEGAQDYLVKGKTDTKSLVRALRYAIERAKREELMEVLRKNQTSHLWKSLFRTLGDGASAILLRAGMDAGSSTFDFIEANWEPRDDWGFAHAIQEHLRLAGVCDIKEMNIDRVHSSIRVRAQGSFECVQQMKKTAAPSCHFLKGLLCGLAGRILGVPDSVCDEITCQAKGDEICEFVVHQMFQ